MAEKEESKAQSFLTILLILSIIASIGWGINAFAEFTDRFGGYSIKIIDTNIIIASFAPVISLLLLSIFLLMCKSFLKK